MTRLIFLFVPFFSFTTNAMIVNHNETIQDMVCSNNGVSSITHKTDEVDKFPSKGNSYGWFDKMTFKKGRWVEGDWTFGLVDGYTYTNGSIIMKSDPDNCNSDPFEKWTLVSVDRNYTRVVHLRCYL